MSNNFKQHLYKSYNFLVYVGNTPIGFSKVSNIEMEKELEEFVIGGQNYAPHYAVASSKKSARLTLENGIMYKGSNSILNWRAGYYIQDTINVFVYEKDVSELIYTRSNRDKRQHAEASGRKYTRSFSISGGMIVKWELGNLDAMSSEILIQKFEIAHAGIIIGEQKMQDYNRELVLR